MKPVSPVIPGENNEEVKIAEYQLEYQTLPSIVLDDGTVISRWEISDEELEIINKNKYIYLQVSTFGNKLQPVLLHVEKPQIIYITMDDYDKKFATDIEPQHSSDVRQGSSE